MKIHIDEFKAKAESSLSAQRWRVILDLIPVEWLSNLSEVHISGSIVPFNSRWKPGDAAFNAYNQRLTIFARDRTPEQLVVPILSALAAHYYALPQRRGGRLSASETKMLAKITALHAEHITQCLAHSGLRLKEVTVPSN